MMKKLLTILYGFMLSLVAGENGFQRNVDTMGARRNFRAPKRPPSRRKRPPPPKKKIVLAPFLGGSEACSPEKKLTVVFPTTL